MASDDDGGFKEFVDARHPDLLRVAYHLTGSADDAEDLVQGALVKVLRRWRRVDEPMAYLRRVMVNQHITAWRRHRAREVVTALLPDRPVRDVADRVTEQQALWQAMRALAPVDGTGAVLGTEEVAPTRIGPGYQVDAWHD